MNAPTSAASLRRDSCDRPAPASRASSLYCSRRFFTLVPCRILDTRNPTGPYGGPALAANTTRNFAIASQCGVPASAKAISVNVTVTIPSVAGNLRLFAAGAAVPLVSTLNYSAAQTRGNNAVVGLGATGLAVRAVQASGSVHAILDVNGYFE